MIIVFQQRGFFCFPLKFWTSFLNSKYGDYCDRKTQCSIKRKKKKTSLQTKSFHMLEKKCFTGARLVHLYHRMITFYLQLNFNQFSHYITICTHVGKSTWLLSGGCSRPPMIDTVLLSWLHQVVTVFKLEWGRISLKIQTAISFHIKKKTWLTVKTRNFP